MRKLIFMCAGQGSHYYQMGRHLYETDAGFRSITNKLDDIHRQQTGFSVVHTIYNDSKRKSDSLDTLSVTHPALFMVQYALGRTLIDAGLAPDIILGSSLGEYVSLALANIVSADELLYAVIRQAAAVMRWCHEARMISVLADASRLAGLSTVNRHATVALVNGKNHVVVVTDVNLADLVLSQLRSNGIASQILPIRYGFHTARIDAARPECEAVARALKFGAGDCHVVSAADPIRAGSMSNAHLWRVIRDQVRFDNAVKHLEQAGRNLYVDLSPTGTLSGFVKHAIGDSGSEVIAAVNPFAGSDTMTLKQLRDRVRP